MKKKLPISSDQLLDLLKLHKIKYDLYLHRPIFTVIEAKSYQNTIFPKNKDCCHIKNLYLRDRNKNNFLITCEQDKEISLNSLKENIKSSRLSFGSPDRLFEFLGVYPGAISPFCMLNGIKKNVSFFCDKALKKYRKIFLHPFVNDRTICQDILDLEFFLNKYHININWGNL